MNKRNLIVIIVLVIFIILSFLLSLSLGAYKIEFNDIIKTLFSDGKKLHETIIWNIRIPRSLTAALVGICLSIAGAILQGVMRNPLASPNIIGVTSGAGFMATIALVLIPKLAYALTPIAFVGAFTTTIIIYILSWKNGIQPFRMVLAGIAISTLLNSLISLILIFYPERVADTLGFKIGSLIAITWDEFYMLLPYALIGVSLAIVFSRKLDILMLGDDIAASLGLNIELTRISFIILASLLAASAISIVGLLGFVGLIVPHIMRILLGTNHKTLFIGCSLFGAGLMMFCDMLSRIIFAPSEIPIGIIMSVIGVPFFLLLLKGGLKNVKG